MNRTTLKLMVCGACMAVGLAAESASLTAELIMPGGRSWQGLVKSRDGDWIEFSTGTGKPIRVGADTIEELVFSIKVDEDKLNEMNRNREYDRVIAILERTVAPFAEYSDIPSNLASYNSLLMELYYTTGQYQKAIELAIGLEGDERDEKIQNKARLYRALALIDLGKSAEAESYLTQLGWLEGLNDDSDPEKLFIAAKLFASKTQYSAAMEMVSKVIAFNSQDPEWMQPAELFCAEIYTELGKENPIMLESALEVIRQISLLYSNTNEDDLAQKLKIKIEGLQAEHELKAENSEDA